MTCFPQGLLNTHAWTLIFGAYLTLKTNIQGSLYSTPHDFNVYCRTLHSTKAVFQAVWMLSLPICFKKKNSPCHCTLAFLYQEYRDTSKQQEIDLRRQRDGLTVKAEASGGLSSSMSSPPVGQLQLRNSINPMSLWQNLAIVQNSSLLNELSQKEIIMQEVSCRAIMSSGRLQ